MNYYIDITLLPSSEITLGFLWKKVYQQVHLALAEQKNSSNTFDFALSFPKYNDDVFPLGNCLRVFSSSKVSFEQLNMDKWLEQLKDYILLSEVSLTPDNVKQFATFKRKQFKSNVSRLARRFAKRKEIDYKEALKHYENFSEQETKLPFVNVKSLSSNNEMKIFILQEFKDKKVEGEFNAYGLSKTATVPWF